MTLHTALESSVKWGLLSRNPANAVSPPKYQRHEWQTLSEEDIGTLLETAKNKPYYALFYTALFTGMRRSELLALRWQDVDFILGRIYVSRALHQLKDGSYTFTQPKSARSRRTIALPPSAIMTLREHQEKQILERAILGTTLTDDDLIFSTIEGKPLRPDTVTHAWIKLVRHTGLYGIRLHDSQAQPRLTNA